MKLILRYVFSLCCLAVVAAVSLMACKRFFKQKFTSNPAPAIALNQIGFYPGWQKIAIIANCNESNFFIEDVEKHVVFKGALKQSASPSLGGRSTLIADFSNFNKSGRYLLRVNSIGYSYPFYIKDSVHSEVAKASLKAFYFIRASIPLKEKYAGKWKRAEGHPDTAVLIHSSAASATRLEGSHISSPGGWYDAGDYNKYIVNSGISTSTLLSLYEDFPEYMKTVNLNIPESGNHVPDILNEILWNLRWMLTMQDPADGGVYHKLTNAAFDKFEMPDQGTAPRYVVQKSTAAALDFAAVMAQSTRIFSKFQKELPGLSDSCLSAAKKAWLWSVKNPDRLYKQNEMNKKFSPQITTGDYGDKNVADEFIWAASELFVTTQDAKYLTGINLIPDESMPIPAWPQVKLLGYYTLIKHEASFKSPPTELPEIKKRLLALADSMVNRTDEAAYQNIMEKSAKDFIWGSNSVAANQGIALILAYKLSHNKKYLEQALNNLDYILGRNATGYSYITGYGAKTPMHPHHRPSASDGIVDPIPGLLAGGPNPGMQDHIQVPWTAPDEAYIDDERAYAVNEVTINWNAPFAYLANAIEALQKIK